MFLLWHEETSPGCWGLGLVGSAVTLSASSQAVVLEGNYWKRRIEVVMREYHKWRIYYKKRVSGSARAASTPALGLAGVGRVVAHPQPSSQAGVRWPPPTPLPQAQGPPHHSGCLLSGVLAP